MSLTRFDEANDIVKLEDPSPIVTSTWTGNTNNLQVAHTASSQANFGSATSSGQFFINVYNEATSSTAAEVQYAIAYGNRHGSGALDFTNDTGSFGLSSARVIYNQYRQLVFQDETQNFKFGSHTPDDIYVINVNRARYKQRLSTGTLNLHISGGGGGAGAGKIVTYHLTDDSVTNGLQGNTLGGFYNIVSGTNGELFTGTDIKQVGGSASYGLFYPHAGLIILNPDAFNHGDAYLVGTTNPNTADKNHELLLRHISAAGHFIVDTEEDINSQFYFVRAKNAQFNYTNNPSFVYASNNINFSTMKMNPKVFITTIGLYNDSNDLLAVAKLSQPVAKDFTKEALIRVKLDF